MLVTGKQILTKAQRGKYAVGAFNVNNLEIVQAVINAAIMTKSPVILQTSEGAIDYGGLNFLYSLMKVASSAPVPVAIHLDHGKNLDLIKECIDLGYTSVMYDGSSLSFEENIKNTKKVVAWAKKKGVSVEAELGAISGIEDLVSVKDKDAHLTNPLQAVEFVKRTGCDSLAIAIGTSHGPIKFKGDPELDLKRLAKIKKLVKVPLVLHGASGVPQEMVKIAKKYGAKLENFKGLDDKLLKQAIKLGICKVNTDTDIRLAFDAGIREIIATKPDVYDPRKIMSKAKEYMYQVVVHRINILGSNNKAKK